MHLIEATATRKALIAIVALALMGAPSVFGAGGQETGSTTGSGEVPKIRYFLPWDPGKPIGNDLWSIVQWEEAAGVDFEIINPPQDTFAEQFTSLVASGRVPDLVNFFRDRESFKEYGPRLFVDISQALDDGKLPNYRVYYEQFRPEFKAIEAPDGHMYGLVQIQTVDSWSSPPWYIRNDILNDIGIDITEKVYTLDELKQILMDLRDHHGGPLTGSRLGYGYTIGRFAHYFGASPDMTSDQRTGGDGKWVYGPAQPSFRTAVETFAWAYENGIFHPDMLTMNKNEFFAGLAGGTFILHMGGGYPNMFNNDPTRDVQLVMPPEMPDGVTRSWALGDHLKYGYRWPVSINKDSKVIDASLRAIDFLYSEEGQILMSRGEEGVTYEVDRAYPAGYQFNQIIEETNQPNAVSALEQYGCMVWWTLGIVDYLAWSKNFNLTPEDSAIADKNLEDINALIENGNLHATELPVVFTEEEQDLRAEILTPLQTYTEENVSKFMTGVRPISEWSQFLKEIENLRYKVLEAIYNTAAAR